MSIRKYQQQIDDWVQGYEKPYWHPLSQFARLVEEVGEVGRLLNHLYGDKPKKDTEAAQELPAELGDILFALICLANSQNIDLDEAIEQVIQKSVTRDENRFVKKRALGNNMPVAGDVYRHYKNQQKYEIVGTALQTETREMLVIYKPLYKNEYELFARPYSMFIEDVESNGERVPRFKKVNA